jgi:hypothetical protein
LKRLYVLLAVSLTACSGCAIDHEEKASTLPGTSVEVKADGSLADDAPPITLQDIKNEPRRSVRRTMLSVWFYGQWGSVPNILPLYEPFVRRAVGDRLILGAYATQREQMLASRPRIAYVRRTSVGTLVGLSVYRRGAVPLRDSFLFRRRNGKWRILYDTILERTFNSYQQFTDSADPAQKPTRKAVLAGKAAADRLRRGHLRALRSARRQDAVESPEIPTPQRTVPELTPSGRLGGD